MAHLFGNIPVGVEQMTETGGTNCSFLLLT